MITLTQTEGCKLHGMSPEEVALWWTRVPDDMTVTVCCCCQAPAPLEEFVVPAVGVYCRRCRVMVDEEAAS